MSDGWQRPGGPPEITFEIPLSGDLGNPAEHDPTPRRASRATVALGVAVALAVVAIVVVATAGEQDAATPSTTGPATIPPTMPPVDAPASATLPPPTFPPSVGMPANMLGEFNLQTLLENTDLDPIVRGVTTLTSPSLGDIKIVTVRDVASQRDQMTVDDGAVTRTVIYDRRTGDTYRTGPDVPAGAWTRQGPDEYEPTAALLDSLLLGPVRHDTIAQAVEIESGPIVVVAMAGRAMGPPMRVFHVTLPPTALTDSVLEEFGLVDPRAPGEPDVVFAVHASERLGVELVATSVLSDGEVVTLRHRTESIAEPATITLPDPATVVDGGEL